MYMIPGTPGAWNISPKPFRPRKSPNGNNQTAKGRSARMRKIRPRPRRMSFGQGLSGSSSSMWFKFFIHVVTFYLQGIDWGRDRFLNEQHSTHFNHYSKDMV